MTRHSRSRAAIVLILGAAVGLVIYFLAGYAPPAAPRAEAAAPRPPPTDATAALRATPPPVQTPKRAAAPPAQPAREAGPFEHLDPDRAQRKVLYEAEELAVSACMKRHGFDYTPNQFIENDPESEIPHYRTGDPDVAGSIGYGILQALDIGELPPPPDANESAVAAMPEAQRAAWNLALFGPRPPASLRPTKGAASTPPDDPEWARVDLGGGRYKLWFRASCFAQARREVHGDEDAFARAQGQARYLLIQAEDNAEKSPEVAAGRDQWRACMERAGHHYDAPGSAARELRGQLQAGQITRDQLKQREIDVASDDARCYQTAHLDELYARAQAAAERTIAAEHIAELDTSRQLHSLAISRAESMLASAQR